MKLLNKSNIYTSFTTLLLLMLGAIIIYCTIFFKLNSEINEHLKQNKVKVIERLKKGEAVNTFNQNIDADIAVKEVAKQTVFEDVYGEYESMQKENDEEEEEEFTFRYIQFQTRVNAKIFEVKITKSLTEGLEIGEYVIAIVLLFLLISLVVLIFVNRYVSKYIWSPFYDTLSKIKHWSIRDKSAPTLKFTDIEEFTELNETVISFTKQLKSDFELLKEFTETISHETQTPLAIISSKIELLMQYENYSEEQRKQIIDAYQTVQRLSKLNNSLVLLTKIENQQYYDVEPINLRNEIEVKLEELSDFIEIKNISVTKSYTKNFTFDANIVLINILLNNLLINAIKHNLKEGGFINIVLKEDCLIIENSGSQYKIDKENIFEKFKKDYTSESPGLGLSIIKKISDTLNWTIDYSYNNGKHSFIMHFLR